MAETKETAPSAEFLTDILYMASQHICEPVINLLIDKYQAKADDGALHIVGLCECDKHSSHCIPRTSHGTTEGH